MWDSNSILTCWIKQSAFIQLLKICLKVFELKMPESNDRAFLLKIESTRPYNDLQGAI